MAIDLAALTGANGFRLYGGRVLPGGGDFDGDGIGDFLIGAPDQGRVSVLYGRAAPQPAEIDLDAPGGVLHTLALALALTGGAGGFGAVAAAGDVNGDGFDDFIVGTPSASGGVGTARVVFGSADRAAPAIDLASLDGSDGFVVTGGAGEAGFGRAVAGGDVNGDGLADLIIGAPPGEDGPGATYVVFGDRGGFAATLDVATLDGSNGFRIEGAASFLASGAAVAAAGDVNGDGFGDVLIAVEAEDGGEPSDETYVVYGAAAGFAATIPLGDIDAADGFRVAGMGGDFTVTAAAAGDVNGDGFDDLVFGATGPIDIGEAYVLFGGPDGVADDAAIGRSGALDGTNGFSIGWLGDGTRVAGAGDVNGDGVDDLLVAAVGDGGETYVVFGSTSGFAARVDLDDIEARGGGFRIDGDDGDHRVAGLAGLGDLDGDGLADVFVAADGRGSGRDLAGYVVMGSADALTPPAFGDPIVGGRGDDTLTGTSAPEIIRGRRGDDVLSGLGGGDVIGGGRGRDLLDGGGGDDEAHGGRGADTLAGGGGDDSLDGGRGRDTLRGDGGADVLSGGRGRDTLVGGAGADHFVFTGALEMDRIADFETVEITRDLIDFSAFGLDAAAFAEQVVIEAITVAGRGESSLVTLRGHGSIVVAGVDPGLLDVTDFLLA